MPSEQAGLRAHLSTTDQLFSITIHIEAGYQRKLKTTVVFIVNTNNTFIEKLYGTTWSSPAATLRCQLLFSAAKYCALVWPNSGQSKLSSQSQHLSFENTVEEYAKSGNSIMRNKPYIFCASISYPTNTMRKLQHLTNWKEHLHLQNVTVTLKDKPSTISLMNI